MKVNGFIVNSIGVTMFIFIIAGITFLGLHCGKAGDDISMDFENRIQDASRDHVFEMEGYYVWGASVIQGEDNKYHMFVSRWQKASDFGGWMIHSQIIRAISDRPEGPFRFQEELTALKEQPWAEKMVHNPMIYKINGTYYLYYIGATWAGIEDENGNLPSGLKSDERQAIRFTQRIGLASAPNLDGPWTPLPSNPILHPRPDKWDSTFTTNPVVYFSPDNKLLMIYKSTTGKRAPLQLGLTTADRPEGPYKRIGREPLFEYDVEESFVWFEKERYWMLSKDMTGVICGIRMAGLLLTSINGINWELAENPLAYHMEIVWSDGTRQEVGRIERPFILVQNGRPVCLYNAIADKAHSYSWNLARLLY